MRNSVSIDKIDLCEKILLVEMKQSSNVKNDYRKVGTVSR